MSIVSSAPTVRDETMNAYQRLHKALSAGLRRQIFLAVCEHGQDCDTPSESLRERILQQLQQTVNEPPLIPITLEGENPNFLAAIATYLKEHPHLSQQDSFPTFALVGIENLTRQPAPIQQQFIRNLRRLAKHLPQLQFSLLLWVSPPWLHTIKQSAPEFWRWHSGIFEFKGDASPNPSSTATASPAAADASPPQTPLTTSEGNFPLVALPVKPQSPPQKTPSVDSATVQEKPQKREDITETDSSPTQNESPVRKAQEWLHNGHYWRDRIAQGDRSPETLTQAIEAYETALASQARFSIEADVLNDLGNFYWMRSRCPASPEDAYPDLEQALNVYLSALGKITDPAQQSQTYAMIQNNLGAAYGDLARYRDFEENLQFSIEAYETALQYRTPSNNTLKYGSTQNNLGTAYWHLAQRQDPVTHLHHAIAAYTEASHHYNPKTDALSWAMIQNNIGTAHWNLAKHEDPQTHLQAAIQSYERSLIYRTPEAAPALCAATQNNLGTAYWHLSIQENLTNEQKCDYLKQSAQAYAIATQLAQELSQAEPPVKVNFNFLSTYNNLGLVNYQLAINERLELPNTERLEHLDAALQAHLQVLTAVPPNSDAYQTAFKYIARTVRAFYQFGGINGQNRALGQVPGPLLPQLLPQL
ncbi:MAG: tetratricopeptide repeat protein [Kamptonema sp. SIO4C4]|nr:tetratricopeptide repeat protein [Kamptonema sp. SIO4C4]